MRYFFFGLEGCLVSRDTRDELMVVAYGWTGAARGELAEPDWQPYEGTVEYVITRFLGFIKDGFDIENN